MQNTVGNTVKKGINLLPPSENIGFIEPETGKGYFFPSAEIPPDHSWKENWGTCLQ